MSRDSIREEELNECIFQPQLESTPTESADLLHQQETVVYTTADHADGIWDDKPILLPEKEGSDHAFAKRSGNIFWAKSDGAQLADPFGLYDKDLYRKVGDQNVFRWMKVSPKVFDLYVAYLGSKNKLYYNNAGREMF